MIVELIIFVACIVIMIFCFYCFAQDDYDTYSGFIGGLFIITVILVCASASVVFTEPKPKAIDVYRGNTTLEITYRDSIPVDSVVVFK